MAGDKEKLNLYQKIVKIREVAGGFSKDSKSYGYEYVSGNQVLSKIKDTMNELNLLLIPSTKVGDHHTHEYVTSKGKDVIDFIVKGEMSYMWINGDNPEETLVIDWAYYGQQDDISKAYGSALTYSERYFLLKCLGLPTDEDDPDAKPKSDYGKSRSSSIGGLTEGQIKRLYAIGYGKGLDSSTINAQIKTKFNKEVSQLTKAEYDTICTAYENMEKKVK